MKKGRLLLIVSIVLLIASYFPFQRFLPPLSDFGAYHDLAARGVAGPTAFLVFRSVSVLDVRIEGANRDVYFYITDDASRRIFDAGRIYDGYHLEWECPRLLGSYRFNFDNTMSLISHKYVTYTLKIYPYSAILFFAGIALFVGGVLQITREETLVSRLKRLIFKKPEPMDVICPYCGTVYSKTLDRCPNCSARKTASS